MFERLQAKGYQVVCVSHAEAILEIDFPEAAANLQTTLAGHSIPIEDIIAIGGGETKATRRLRRSLAAHGWRAERFTVGRSINGQCHDAVSHRIDHVCTLSGRDGRLRRLALEIEWNNKDPFFDRDLDNFKRLHADGAISVGIILTRGVSLQGEMRALVRRWADHAVIDSFADLATFGIAPTPRQCRDVMARMVRPRNPLSFRQAWADTFVGDKFGAATTHWRKLEDCVRRGSGHPCPLLLIGLPVSIVTFGAAPPPRLAAPTFAEAAYWAPSSCDRL